MYEIIKEEAKKQGLSIKQVEQKAGLGNATIGGWKKSSPTLDSLEKVADALGVKAETLIRRKRSKQ